MKLLRLLAPAALLCLCVVAIEYKALSGLAPLIAHHDNLDGANPLRLEAARQWRSGRIPLWNPYKRVGMPLLADTTAAAIYPGNIPFLLDSGESRFSALKQVAVLHAMLASVLMYAFLRTISLGVAASLLGGLVFGCNGVMTWFSAMYIQLQNSAAWLPLILLAVHKASDAGVRNLTWVALGGAAVALQFFSGFPEFSVYSGLLAAGYGLSLVRQQGWWRPVAAVGAVYVAGILLSAVQLLPALELQSLSRRPLAMTLEIFQSQPASPRMVLGWLLPAALPIPPGMLGGYHLGIIATVLIPAGLYGRDHRRRFFTIVLVLGFLMAVGSATRFNGWAYHLPGVSAFRHPFKHLFEVYFAAAALAALGADSVLRKEQGARAITRVSVVAALVVCVVVPIDALSPIVVGALAAALAAFALAAAKGMQGVAVAIALAASILSYRVIRPPLVGDLSWWAGETVSGYPPIAPMIEPGWRVLAPRPTSHARLEHALFGDYATEARVLAVHGAGPFLWDPLAEVTGMIEEETAFRPGLFGGRDKTLAILSARYVVATFTREGGFSPQVDPESYRLVYEVPLNFRVHELKAALPRFRLVRQVRCADEQATDFLVHGPGATLSDLALVACGGERDRPSRQKYAPGDVTIVSEEPGRIALSTRISGEEPGFLIVGQSDYPGWRAHVNGAEQPIRRVYGILQGLEVAPGTSEVVLTYRPKSFQVGALVSAMTLLLLVGTVARQQRLDIVLANMRPRSLRVCAFLCSTWFLAPLTALVLVPQFLATRFHMNPDGIHYVDMASAVAGGDWSALVNGYWSPLYPAILAVGMKVFEPSAQNEVVFVHALNVAIVALAYIAFFACWNRLSRRLGHTAIALNPIGHAVFVACALGQVGLVYVTPDMLLLALIASAMACLASIDEHSEPARFVLLGVLLGLAFLAKAVMLPLSTIVLLAAGILNGGPLSRALPRVAIAAASMALVAATLVVPLSIEKGRLTTGDVSTIAYALFVNRIETIHPTADDLPPGMVLAHPSRQISSDPDAFEFGSRFEAATYPYAYDLSYWLEGVTARFDWSQQRRALAENLPVLARKLMHGPHGYLVVFGVALVLIALARRTIVPSAGRLLWPSLLLSLAATTLYVLVWVEGRYLGPTALHFWIAVLLATYPLAMRRSVLAEICALALLAAVAHSVYELRSFGIYPIARNTHWAIAQKAARYSIGEGSRIAVVGLGGSGYWARVAGARIVAEVPPSQLLWGGGPAAEFWKAPEDLRQRTIDALFAAGADAVVATPRPRDRQWVRLGVDWSIYAPKP